MASRRVRSFWLAAVSVLVLWAAAARRVPAACAQAAASPHTRRNVVVVLVDDIGWSDTGPFGSETATPSRRGDAARCARLRLHVSGSFSTPDQMPPNLAIASCSDWYWPTRPV